MTRSSAIHPDPVWLAQRSHDVLSAMEQFALSQSQTPLQSRLLERALLGFRTLADSSDPIACIHFPLLVYGGIRGDDTPAIPLAAVTGLQYLGVDIIDDLTDGDKPAQWQGVRTGEIMVIGASLLCALPQLALAQLDTTPLVLRAMTQALAQGLQTMAAGQLTDLDLMGGDAITVDDVEASVMAKSGGELAMWATLAAQYANAPEEIIAAYAQIGQAIGTAGEIGASCTDLFHQPHSRDLASGTRTLPIAYYLERLQGQERTTFLNKLDQARDNAPAQQSIRTELQAAGVVRRCAVVAEVYRQRALRALNRAAPLEPARSALVAMIDRVRFGSTASI